MLSLYSKNFGFSNSPDIWASSRTARAKATVGEISSALEKVFGRHRAEIKAITGVYKREVGMTDAVERVRQRVKRAIRLRDPEESERRRVVVLPLG